MVPDQTAHMNEEESLTITMTRKNLLNLSISWLSLQPTFHPWDIYKQLLFQKIKACKYQPASASLPPGHFVTLELLCIQEECGEIVDHNTECRKV